MAAHNDLGKAGEEAAVRYLESKGFVIRHRNWRFKHWELDIVAYKDGEVRVIEVKTRTRDNFKSPIESVDRQKRKRLMLNTLILTTLCILILSHWWAQMVFLILNMLSMPSTQCRVSI